MKIRRIEAASRFPTIMKVYFSKYIHTCIETIGAGHSHGRRWICLDLYLMILLFM